MSLKEIRLLHNELLINIAIVITLAISAQWLAWRLKLPSILLLLLAGFLAGPITNILDVDHLMGELLFPVVSVSVAIIMFEGGLSLRFSDLRETGRVFRNLLTIGVLITWLLSALTAYVLLGLGIGLSLLIGGILVVTGPTVIIPMLKQIRPSARVASILRWEGIVIDPVGAVLAVLVFEAIIATDPSSRVNSVLAVLTNTILIGTILGFVVARLLILFFGRHWVPENLQNPVTLMAIIGAFAASNVMQAESGLLTVTVMGVVIANQELTFTLPGLGKWMLGGVHRMEYTHIIEFKENLQVLLVGMLFILLAARLRLEDLQMLGVNNLLFLLVLVFIIRPISVWVSAWGSPLRWQEKLFIAWMAPRGIVAAAVASIFALELANHGIENANVLVSVVFSVIIFTVVVYGLTAGPLARRLGVAQTNPQGLLIIGAHEWAQEIAKAVQAAGFRVLLVDTNYAHIQQARMEGLPVFYGSILAEYTSDEIDLSGLGRMIALTPNDEVNALAVVKYTKVFGRQNVYQLAPNSNEPNRKQAVSQSLVGRFLFGPMVTYAYLDERFRQNGTIKTTRLTPEFDAKAFREEHGGNALPLFTLTSAAELLIASSTEMPRLQVGTGVISLVDHMPVPEAEH